MAAVGFTTTPEWTADYLSFVIYALVKNNEPCRREIEKVAAMSLVDAPADQRPQLEMVQPVLRMLLRLERGECSHLELDQLLDGEVVQPFANSEDSPALFVSDCLALAVDGQLSQCSELPGDEELARLDRLGGLPRQLKMFSISLGQGSPDSSKQWAICGQHSRMVFVSYQIVALGISQDQQFVNGVRQGKPLRELLEGHGFSFSETSICLVFNALSFAYRNGLFARYGNPLSEDELFRALANSVRSLHYKISSVVSPIVTAEFVKKLSDKALVPLASLWPFLPADSDNLGLVEMGDRGLVPPVSCLTDDELSKLWRPAYLRSLGRSCLLAGRGVEDLVVTVEEFTSGRSPCGVFAAAVCQYVLTDSGDGSVRGSFMRLFRGGEEDELRRISAQPELAQLLKHRQELCECYQHLSGEEGEDRV